MLERFKIQQLLKENPDTKYLVENFPQDNYYPDLTKDTVSIIRKKYSEIGFDKTEVPVKTIDIFCDWLNAKKDSTIDNGLCINNINYAYFLAQFSIFLRESLKKLDLPGHYFKMHGADNWITADYYYNVYLYFIVNDMYTIRVVLSTNGWGNYKSFDDPIKFGVEYMTDYRGSCQGKTYTKVPAPIDWFTKDNIKEFMIKFLDDFNLD